MPPFRIDVPEPVLDDLRDRLTRTRWPVPVRGVGWDRGTDPGYLHHLVEYWRDGYDWRAQETALNELSHHKADGLHFVHQRAADPDAPVLLLLHGWPDSFLRFRRVLPLLTDFHVVVPSLPGYGFSDPPTEPGHVSRTAMAQRMAGLMASLGHDRYFLSGGDIGSGTAEALAAAHPDRVAGLHLTDLPLWHLTGLDPAASSEAERDYLAAAADWQRREGAYLQLQATKPMTAAYGLTDSPAGLAAWIVEKLRAWSDDFSATFPPDEVLTHVTLYWVTGTIGSSFGPYAERETAAPHGRVTVPAAVSQFPADTLRAPREYAERFLDVRQWREHERGGHFAALEVPGLFAEDLHAFLADLR
ncbi:MAG TPA: epoxide hydrolase [Mycobacteriales bacterium]|nr:epoxide hydrolase [Mycobacteriales bacterium]